MMKEKEMIPASGPGVHTGSDGRLYCNVCGEARQVRLTFGDKSVTVPCNCACLEKQWQQRQDDLHRQEELDRIERSRVAAIPDSELRWQRFESSEYDSRGIQIARNYARQWSQMESRGQGLLLWGPPGTGKTYAAACIANALVDRKVPVLMGNLSQMLGAIPAPASGDQAGAIDRLLQCSLLILDDLGAERSSSYINELVYRIIDGCYRAGKPMVITTNLTMQELEHPETKDRGRIYQRILERCTPVLMNENTIREDKRKQNQKFAREVLVNQ